MQIWKWSENRHTYAVAFYKKVVVKKASITWGKGDYA